MINKKLKMFLSLLLVGVLMITGLSINLPFAQASNKNVELTKLKTNLETNGMLYITDKTVYTEKKFNFNKKDITTKITSIKSQNYSQAANLNFKNIVVDAVLLNNKDVLNKVRASYNNGCKIVILNDNIKASDAFSVMGENIPGYIKQLDDLNKSDQLTTIAISVFKDSSGTIHPAILNVEINNSDEALKAIIIAFRDDNDTSLPQNKEQSIIQTIKPAQAAMTTSWTPVASWPLVYDSWQTCMVMWSINLVKIPTGPDSNGMRYCLGDTPVTVTPYSGYFAGGVHVKLTSNSSGGVLYYAPTPLTNQSSFSASIGVPYAASLSLNFAKTMDVAVSSGTGYVDFAFTPVGLFGIFSPTSYQTFYEGAVEYGQYPTWYGQGFSYTVDMYRYMGSTIGYVWYATASHSGLSVSGT